MRASQHGREYVSGSVWTTWPLNPERARFARVTRELECADKCFSDLPKDCALSLDSNTEEWKKAESKVAEFIEMTRSESPYIEQRLNGDGEREPRVRQQRKKRGPQEPGEQEKRAKT